MINVTRSSMPSYEEYCQEIKDLWDSHWLTNLGEKHQKLENNLKQYLDVDNIELMVNGHMSLEIALQALNMQGDVITSPFTFASTTHAIIRNNLNPVFCDINPDDFTIDVSKIERLITDKTCAIMPVHVYGNICDVEEIKRISNKYGLKVIYDAAHAFGVKYKGKGIGRFGDASCFSFHATKVFNTIEGGAVCFADSELGRDLRRLRNFGIRNAEIVDGIGANAKMNEYCAAMGICNLRHIDEEIKKRKRIVECYLNYLENQDGLQLNPIQKNIQGNYAYFPIVVNEKVFGSSRNEILDALQRHSIYARKYFYPLTNSFECFHNKYNVDETPVALHISKRVLTLPLYSDMEEKDVKRICEIVLRCKSL